jgi:Pvc16 N-terminal domain/IPT/TIG domain
MSNVLSIAAVTATIKDLIENGLVSDAIVSSIGDVIVTALPPDRISVEADERPQLNLFLYQISPNRNADWVSNTAEKPYLRDLRSSTPPLALDLYYLLTAYGAKDFQAELLLGYVINLLYKIPVLTSDRIETALTNATKVSAANVFSQALSAISTAELAQNLGEIKISSEFFNLEETSRLWSVLQTNYRPSTAYRVSMVSIPDRHECPQSSALDNIPQIDRVSAIGDRAITVGNLLLIRGRDLRADITQIRLGKMEILVNPNDVSPTQISFKIPPNLYAGVHGVQVLHSQIATPVGIASPLEHRPILLQRGSANESNLVAFILHPEITATVTNIQSIDKELRSADIAVKFSPKIGSSQQVILLLKEVSNPQTIAYSCPAIPISKDTDLLTFNIPNILAGTYLVQARVDGAESPLPIFSVTAPFDNRFGQQDGTKIVIQ